MTPLDGKRVLLLEDEIILSMMAEDLLADLGAAVVGPAVSVQEGLRLAAEETLDVAVLDVNMNGERSWPVAELLRERGVPFIFATGYGKIDWAAGPDVQVLDKPYTAAKLAAAIGQALADGG